MHHLREMLVNSKLLMNSGALALWDLYSVRWLQAVLKRSPGPTSGVLWRLKCGNSPQLVEAQWLEPLVLPCKTISQDPCPLPDFFSFFPSSLLRSFYSCSMTNCHFTSGLLHLLRSLLSTVCYVTTWYSPFYVLQHIWFKCHLFRDHDF